MKKKIAGLVLLVLSVAVVVSAQTTGTLQGQVSIKGRSPANLMVFIWKQPYYVPNPPDAFSTITDKEGNFKIDVPAGSYYVSVSAPGYYAAIDGAPASRPAAAVVKAGETLSNLEFKLLKGGVITGRVTTDYDRPVIDNAVTLSFNGKNAALTSFQVGDNSWAGVRTDDRGVYRFFGVPPGEYRVTAGERSVRSSLYEMASYRADPEAKEPTSIKLAEGEEISGIDIRLKSVGPTFSISGTTVDAATDVPIANVTVGLYTYTNNERAGTRPGTIATNRRGEFTFTLVPAGKYAVFISGRAPLSNAPDLVPYFGESVPFEVGGEDVSGLKLKAVRTATVSGSVQLIGEPSKQSLAALQNLTISASTLKPRSAVSYRTARLAPDGTFSVAGLLPGPLSFGIMSMSFRVVRVESSGTTGPIEVGTEDISGITIVLAEASGSVRGAVQILNKQSFAGLRGQASVYNEKQMVGYAAIDPAGNFLIENLPAGSYRLVTNVELSGMTPASTHAEQTVVVKEREIVDVRVPLDPKPFPRSHP